MKDVTQKSAGPERVTIRWDAAQARYTVNRPNFDGDVMVAADAYDALKIERDELVALVRQIHEAANRVYQMGDATARNALVNIYEISGKVLELSRVSP